MTRKRKRARHESVLDQRTEMALRVLEAYGRHYDSTTQRKDAAADLEMDLETFRTELNNARLLGLDIEAKPRSGPASGTP